MFGKLCDKILSKPHDLLRFSYAHEAAAAAEEQRSSSSGAADGAVGADGADDAVSSLSCSHYAISRLVCIVANATRCRDPVAALADSQLSQILNGSISVCVCV